MHPDDKAGEQVPGGCFIDWKSQMYGQSRNAEEHAATSTRDKGGDLWGARCPGRERHSSAAIQDPHATEACTGKKGERKILNRRWESAAEKESTEVQ